MYSDFIIFLKQLLLTKPEAGSFLPESFSEQLPMESIASFFSGLSDTVKIAGAGVTLILAILACFFGYKLTRVFMSITGFLAGLFAGFFISHGLLALSRPLIVVCTLLGGVIMALLSYWIYVAGLFILCFMLAFFAAASLLPFSGDIQFFLSTLIGFIVGSLSIKFIRPVIIFSSGIVGGTMAAGVLVTIFDRMHVHTFSFLGTGGLTILIAALGIVVQFLTTSEEDEKKRRKKRVKKLKEQEAA